MTCRVDVVAVVGLLDRPRSAGALSLRVVVLPDVVCRPLREAADTDPARGALCHERASVEPTTSADESDDSGQVTTHRAPPAGGSARPRQMPAPPPGVAPSGGVNTNSASGSRGIRFHFRMVTVYCGTSSSVL